MLVHQKKVKSHEDFDNIRWTVELVETILFREFAFLNDEKNEMEKRIECLAVYHIHNSTSYNLTFGLMKDGVLNAVMLARLMEFDLCWYYAFKSFSRRVASQQLKCEPDEVKDEYLKSRTNEKDTKRYMARLLHKINWEVSDDVFEYFEIERLKKCPGKVNELVTNHYNKCGKDPDKTLNGFFGAICFLNDYPSVCITNYDLQEEDQIVLHECVDRLTTLFYGLSTVLIGKEGKKCEKDVKRLGNILEIFYLLLECENEDDFKNHLIKAFKENMTETVVQHLLVKYSRRIYTQKFEKSRKDFLQIEKDIVHKMKASLKK